MNVLRMQLQSQLQLRAKTKGMISEAGLINTPMRVVGSDWDPPSSRAKADPLRTRRGAAVAGESVSPRAEGWAALSDGQEAGL